VRPPHITTSSPRKSLVSKVTLNPSTDKLSDFEQYWRLPDSWSPTIVCMRKLYYLGSVVMCFWYERTTETKTLTKSAVFREKPRHEPQRRLQEGN